MLARASSVKVIAICLIGSILEWYDFALFGLLAPVLSMLFFSSVHRVEGLLLVFATFASGYIMRPLGAIFFGSLADRKGRKRTLTLTILGMALATTLIGCAPLLHEAGVWMMTLLVFLRLMQGFFASGEYPSAAALLFESASEEVKGLFCSFSIAGLFGGILLASLVVGLLSYFFSRDEIMSFAWRWPFLLGAPLGILGLYLRKRLEESIPFQNLKKAKKIDPSPILSLRKHIFVLSMLVVLYGLPNVVFYTIFIYIPAKLVSAHFIPLKTVAWLNSLAMLVLVIFLVVFGYLSDRFGRVKWILIGAFGVLIGSPVLFNGLFSSNVIQVFLVLIFYAVMTAMLCSPMIVFAAGLFPITVRVSGLALTNNLSGALFGGTAPLVCVLLIQHTNQVISPAYYLMTFSFVALIVLYRVARKV